ncbi:MAG: RNA-binding protein [Candidatus Thermoplasmatota archaeon]
MKNLNEIIDKIEKNIDAKDEIREKSLHFSRDIIKKCRKSIQHIHQNSLEKAERYIKQASKELGELFDLTSPHPELFHKGYVENASQELVEAYCLLNIKKGKELPDPDDIQTSYSSYLLGLCDLVGELRREALDSVRKGNSEKADENLKMMEEIYNLVIRFDYPSGLVPIKKKQDIIRRLIEKTRGELTVANCEKRMEYHTEEFRGILDRLSSQRPSKEDKKKKEELDIDKIW